MKKSPGAPKRPDSKKEDILIAVMCAALILLSFWLSPHGNGLSLSIPGAGIELSLPPTCSSKILFGISCPACGLTRSFTALAHGNFVAAVGFNLMGPVIFALCLSQVPYRLAKNSPIGANRIFALIAKHGNKIACVVLFGLAAAWVYKIVTNVLLMHGCCD
jgi:hypothetical protein